LFKLCRALDDQTCMVHTDSSAAANRPVAEWSTSEVAAWAVQQGLGETVLSGLLKHNVDGPVLLLIDLSDIEQDLGVTGIRAKKVLAALEQLKSRNDAAFQTSQHVSREERHANSSLEWAAEELENVLKMILKPHGVRWSHDLKLLLGAMLWGCTWCFWFFGGPWAERHPRVGIYGSKVCATLGQNLVVLSFLQTMPIQGFIVLIVMCIGNIISVLILFHDKGFQAPVGDGVINFEVSNLYEDLATPFLQVLILFVGQVSLFILVVYHTFVNLKSLDNLNYGFWVISFVAVQMSGFFGRGSDSQIGKTWDLERFQELVNINSLVEYKAPKAAWHTIPMWRMRLRQFTGFTVNTFIRDVIAYLTPILLIQSDNAMDLVQNCFAVAYITTLDDMENPREILVRLRDRQANE